VPEILGNEIGSQRTVEHAQHVEVELGGHAGGVVVGCLDPRHVLDEIRAEKKVLARFHPRSERGQEGVRFGRSEVAERTTQEDDEAWHLGRRQAVELLHEVADQRMDPQVRILVDEIGLPAGATVPR